MTMKWADILHTEASGWTVLVRLSVGLVVFSAGRHSEVDFPGHSGRGTLRQDRHSVARRDGAIRRVVETVCGLLIIIGLFYPSRRDSADHHHDRSADLNQASDPAWA